MPRPRPKAMSAFESACTARLLPRFELHDVVVEDVRLDRDEELAVALEDDGLLVVGARELLDGFDRLPDRDDHELDLAPVVAPQHLDAEVAGCREDHRD